MTDLDVPPAVAAALHRRAAAVPPLAGDLDAVRGRARRLRRRRRAGTVAATALAVAAVALALAALPDTGDEGVVADDPGPTVVGRWEGDGAAQPHLSLWVDAEPRRLEEVAADGTTRTRWVAPDADTWADGVVRADGSMVLVVTRDDEARLEVDGDRRAVLAPSPWWTPHDATATEVLLGRPGRLVAVDLATGAERTVVTGIAPDTKVAVSGTTAVLAPLTSCDLLVLDLDGGGTRTLDGGCPAASESASVDVAPGGDRVVATWELLGARPARQLTILRLPGGAVDLAVDAPPAQAMTPLAWEDAATLVVTLPDDAFLPDPGPGLVLRRFEGG